MGRSWRRRCSRGRKAVKENHRKREEARRRRASSNSYVREGRLTRLNVTSASLSARVTSILEVMLEPRPSITVMQALSEPRMSTYLTATGDDEARAIDLYTWNARVSAALMVPAHLAEVTTRNAAHESLTAVYGDHWPWDRTFAGSLPDGGGRGYSPRRDLELTRSKYSTSGKVIADLKFVFWEKLFTARHDERLWSPRVNSLFPGSTVTAKETRDRIRQDLEVIRRLRNRIAHHEPIFTRNLRRDLDMILHLIQIRSQETATLARELEEVSTLLNEQP